MMEIEQIKAKLSRRPHSPLFARLADDYLSSGNVEEALELCASGLQVYPLYPTAHLVKAKCHVLKEDYLSALVHLRYALDVLPDSNILLKFETEWKERSIIQQSPQPVSVLPLENILDVNLPVIIQSDEQPQHYPSDQVPEEPVTVEMKTSSEPEVIGAEVNNVEDELQDGLWISPVTLPTAIEDQSSSVALQEVSPVISEKPSQRQAIEGGRIVSKTLAEIYAKQGEFGEAILTYQLLKQQRPNLSEEFERRIQELEVKLASKQN